MYFIDSERTCEEQIYALLYKIDAAKIRLYIYVLNQVCTSVFEFSLGKGIRIIYQSTNDIQREEGVVCIPHCGICSSTNSEPVAVEQLLCKFQGGGSGGKSILIFARRN